MSAASTAVVGLLVLLGSSVPFLPTGELVSASAALASGSLPAALGVYAACLLASVAGDAVMFLGARSAARHLSPHRREWLAARKLAPAVRHAQARLSVHPYQSVITGRLLPGGRAPVIIALGSNGHPLRSFLTADAVACAVWAAVYVALGLLGGRLSSSPAIGLAVAIGAALAIGLMVRLLGRIKGTATTAVTGSPGPVDLMDPVDPAADLLVMSSSAQRDATLAQQRCRRRAAAR